MTSSIFCSVLKAEKIEAWLTELTRSFPLLSGPILSSSAARVWVKQGRIWKVQREELGREVCVCVGDPVGPCGLFDDFALYSNWDEKPVEVFEQRSDVTPEIILTAPLRMGWRGVRVETRSPAGRLLPWSREAMMVTRLGWGKAVVRTGRTLSTCWRQSLWDTCRLDLGWEKVPRMSLRFLARATISMEEIQR